MADVFQNSTKPTPMLDPESVRVDELLQEVRPLYLPAKARSDAMSVVHVRVPKRN
jgi:hypothetical protein